MFGVEVAQGEWAPIAGALVSVALILRIVYRYDRTFVADARDELDRARKDLVNARAEIAGLAAQVAACREEGRADRAELHRLRARIDQLPDPEATP